jgi:GNAT superfamily N-acetyltransferase
LERVDILQVQPEELERFLSWVHWSQSPEEVAIIKDEYNQRQRLSPGPPPFVAERESKWIAGVYFTCLPGRLAMMGAVRALDGFLALGSTLLQSLADKLRAEYDLLQIQAVVPEGEQSAQQMLEFAGFQRLTAVDQMWLTLPPVINASTPKTLEQIDSGHLAVPNNGQRDSRPSLAATEPGADYLRWLPASVMTEEAFAELLMATFEQTLDCPELNGMRSGKEVLASFLMGQNFHSMPLWQLAYIGDEPAGCLLLSHHPNAVVEVAYMGLVPAARCHGLGRALVERAKQMTRQLGSSSLVLAVDYRNNPAIKTYVRSGFQNHQRLVVYHLPLATQYSPDHLIT